MAQCYHYSALYFSNEEANKEFTEDQQDQILIAEFEAKKQAIMESDMPAFLGPDPSIF